MTKYIVMERGYEYNDEYYCAQDGGSPKKIFDNIEDAKDRAAELTLKWLLSVQDEFMGYTEYETAKSMFKKSVDTDEYFTEDDYEINWIKPPDLALAAAMRNPPFFVTKCEE